MGGSRRKASFNFLPQEVAAVHVVAGPALAAPGPRVADGHGATFDVRHLGGPVAAAHSLDGFGTVGWILTRTRTRTRTSMQRRPLKTSPFALCYVVGASHHLEAESLTHGGADALHAPAALHLQADAGEATAEVEALPRPRQRQQRYHDDQPHPLPACST